MRAIDLFAGWGGFTLGAEQAGVRVVWAANHWPLAVETHAANHPQVEHVCQDLRQADWTRLPAYDLLLASPACQGHSTAAQPQRRRCGRTRVRHDEDRATAWAVVDCADVTEPQAIIVENVPSFRGWRLYPVWREALQCIGYSLTEYIVRASHYGVPQRRDRLLVVGLRGRAIAPSARVAPEPPIGPCIDWHDGEWRHVSGATPGAQRRIAAGRRWGKRYLVQHVTGHQGIPLSEPIRTITCADQWAVVDGDQYRPLTLRETARAMGFPDDYRWPADAGRRDVVRGLGNAVCPPVAREEVRRVMEAA